ncbi:hypothetical protein B0H13DRAFT_2045320 [Mycena leptocephala]|nr:hypothetical protein B0H13DRAFT_2045320 [Mycena leptocephala]
MWCSSSRCRGSSISYSSSFHSSFFIRIVFCFHFLLSLFIFIFILLSFHFSLIPPSPPPLPILSAGTITPRIHPVHARRSLRDLPYPQRRKTGVGALWYMGMIAVAVAVAVAVA